MPFAVTVDSHPSSFKVRLKNYCAISAIGKVGECDEALSSIVLFLLVASAGESLRGLSGSHSASARTFLPAAASLGKRNYSFRQSTSDGGHCEQYPSTKCACHELGRFVGWSGGRPFLILAADQPQPQAAGSAGVGRIASRSVYVLIGKCVCCCDT